jgi:hypothetical protein
MDGTWIIDPKKVRSSVPDLLRPADWNQCKRMSSTIPVIRTAHGIQK